VNVATRYHDFSYGHRVVGHEGKCIYLHGHNGRVHFHCRAHTLDAVGRVIDFSVINARLCQWVEQKWDHRFLMWEQDLLLPHLRKVYPSSIVIVPFNPTAENLATHLLRVIGPMQMADTDVTLFKVVFEETRKCSASDELSY
jgi:6-pyruvoyltetrahydropterin/6-carboxytetrahydropterin synthase